MPNTALAAHFESKLVSDLSQVKAVVFDLDGTLVDSMEGFGEIASGVIHKYFGIAHDEALVMYRQTSGLPFLNQLLKLFGNDTRVPQASNEYEAAKLKGYHAAGFFHDVSRALPLLKQAGFKLCVSSNNSEENVTKKMGPHGALFDLILGHHQNFFKGADHFKVICDELKLKPSQLAFVGDSLNDARVANECGLPFIARLGTFHATDFDGLGFGVHKVQNFFELVQLLSSIKCN